MSNEVIKVVDYLVQKLGPIGEIVWKTTLRQQIIEGYLDFLWAFIIATIAIIGYRVIKSLLPVDDPFSLDQRNFKVLSFFIGSLVLIVVLTFISIGFQQIQNPEYFAIQSLSRLPNQ